MNRLICILLLLMVLLPGCAGPSTIQPTPAEPEPLTAEPDKLPDAEQVASEAQEGGPSLEVAPLENPAVAQLVEQAETQRAAGDLAASSALLERALRLEPENPRLWQRLAEIRLAQGHYLEAEEMAMRSLGNSGRVGEWCRRNWLTLRATRTALGDPVEADRAAEQAASCQLPPPPRF